MNLPTKITFSRIIATVVLIITLFVLSVIPNLSTPILGNTRINLIFLIVFVFFVIASYTDHLDGKLARKNNQVTDLGKFLDPVADKLLVSSMLIFLCAYYHAICFICNSWFKYAFTRQVTYKFSVFGAFCVLCDC